MTLWQVLLRHTQIAANLHTTMTYHRMWDRISECIPMKMTSIVLGWSGYGEKNHGTTILTATPAPILKAANITYWQVNYGRL